MTRRRIIIGWVMLFLVAALIFMPLRLIIGGQGVSARKVEGIIWDGSIRDLRVGQLRVGKPRARHRQQALRFGVVARFGLELADADEIIQRGQAQGLLRSAG